MSSKRLVPEQEIAELSDDMVRRLALKDAEIAELRNALAYQDKRWRRATENMLVARRERDEAQAEIAALTEQRDRAMRALRFICVIDALDASLFERVEHGRVTLAALDTPSLPESPEASEKTP